MNRTVGISARRGALFCASALSFGVVQSGFCAANAQAQTPALPVSAPAAPAPLVNPPQNAALSIGPGLFTFPQIAALLSTPEQPITCDFSMKDRAAFVYLKNRTHEQAKELLGAGLQIEFVPAPPANGTEPSEEKAVNKPNPLRMVRLKAVNEREFLWLRRLARLLQTELQNKTSDVVSQFDTPLPDVDQIAKMEAEAQALNKEIGDPADSASQDAVTTQKRERMNQLFAAINAQYKIPKASERMTAAWAQNNLPILVSLLQGKKNAVMEQSIAPAFLQNGWATQAIADNLKIPTAISLKTLPDGFRAGNFAWAAHYKAAPLLDRKVRLSVTGHLTHQESAVSAAAYADAFQKLGKQDTLSDEEKQNATAIYYLNSGFSCGMEAQIPHDYDASHAHMPGALFVLGADAIKWETEEKAVTDAWLQRSAADAVTPFSASAPKNAVLGGVPLIGPLYKNVVLSDAAAYFSATAHTEIVMELHPRAEMWQTEEEAPKLSAWIKRPNTPEQWSVREKNNVLLITNRLAFIERPQNVPLPELLQLHSDLEKWHEENDAPPFQTAAPTRDSSTVPPYEPLAAYARAVMTRRDGRTWGAVDYTYASPYHGIHLDALDLSVPVLYLWGKLSDRDRAQILSDLVLAKPGETHFSTADVPLLSFQRRNVIGNDGVFARIRVGCHPMGDRKPAVCEPTSRLQPADCVFQKNESKTAELCGDRAFAHSGNKHHQFSHQPPSQRFGSRAPLKSKRRAITAFLYGLGRPPIGGRVSRWASGQIF